MLVSAGEMPYLCTKKDMANYCGTNYFIEGDATCLWDLYNVLRLVESEKTDEDLYSRQWMGRVAEAFGLAPKDYYCVGHFLNLRCDKENMAVSFYVESANCPCDELMDAILAIYNESDRMGNGGKLTMLYFVSQDDEGIYYTNDREGRIFPDRYEVDLEDIDDEWFTTLPDAVEWIRQKTGIVIPEDIASDEHKLYEYITNDMEECLGMCCNFHIVEVEDGQ